MWWHNSKRGILCALGIKDGRTTWFNIIGINVPHVPNALGLYQHLQKLDAALQQTGTARVK